MSETTEETEEFISLYEGSGKLNEQDCEFQVGQRSNGQIRVYCKFSESPDIVNAHGVALSGWTNDGLKVCAKGPLQRRPWDVDYETEPETYFSQYRMTDLTIGEPDWSDTHLVKFAVTNLLFCGNDVHSGGRGTCYNALKLKLNDLNITFHKVDDYYEIENSVISGNQTEVTCELAIEVSNRNCEEIRKVANRICDLLTIAKGRKIEWINYRVYDANSSIIFMSYQARRTDPRIGYKLIDFRQANRAINYLERGFLAYEKFDLCHPTLLNGIANIMFDTNAARFTITHALSMNCMVDAISKRVCNNDHFESRIKRLNNVFGVCLTSKERKYFVDSRNSVVHELKFHTSDIRKEYETCYHIFHRLILRILDYQSEYFDITLQRGDPRFLVSKLRACPKQRAC